MLGGEQKTSEQESGSENQTTMSQVRSNLGCPFALHLGMSNVRLLELTKLAIKNYVKDGGPGAD